MTLPRTQRRNANKHSPRGMAQLERSIQSDGWIGAITVAADGETFDGSARVDVAAATGFEDAVVVESDGTRPVIVRRTDIPSADDPRAVRLGIAANRIASVNLDWDAEVLAELAGEIDLSEFWHEDELRDLLTTTPSVSESAYTTDTPSPIYTPTGEQPDVATLMDTSRRDALARDIAAVNLPDDVRDFLNAATTRHVVFDYRNIAEFYAHADADTQRLMEDSALVIVDFKRAIELGYVRLSSRLNDILGETLDDDA